ncbi:ABC transporter permease [Microtetraspora niveoalba]|uniref:ABC transporter permease n=1 Tax=Microtetraspora niveoalba TaxID=46175 RepID=UPI00082FAFAB|nr:ABC transporter permease [Microtetraspora niveoalba]
MLLKILGRGWLVASFGFLLAPILVVVGASFTSGSLLTFPPEGFSFRWYQEIVGDEKWMAGLTTSLNLAFVSALGSTAAATAAALGIRRLRRGGTATGFLLTLPLAVPKVAVGLALLGLVVAFALNGTMSGLMTAHLIITMPYAFVAVSAGVAQLDRFQEEASRTLGAGPVRTFVMVTLPQLAPGIAAAFLFSTIVSFQEVSVTLFLVGPGTNTLPVRMFSHILDSADPAVASISALVVIATYVLLALFVVVTRRREAAGRKGVAL